MYKSLKMKIFKRDKKQQVLSRINDRGRISKECG